MRLIEWWGLALGGMPEVIGVVGWSVHLNEHWRAKCLARATQTGALFDELWLLEVAGVEMGRRLGRLALSVRHLPPSANHLSPTAMICHDLPSTVTRAGKKQHCGLRSFGAMTKVGRRRCCDGVSCYGGGCDRSGLLGSAAGAGERFEKGSCDPLWTCHRLPHRPGLGLQGREWELSAHISRLGVAGELALCGNWKEHWRVKPLASRTRRRNDV